MTFKTAYTHREFERKPMPRGTQLEPVYIMEYDKDGHKHLVQNGFTDTQEIIQANLESTKIENIIRRCTDPTLLQAKITQFIDATQMPKNLYEVQNIILRVKDEFAKLPIDIKAQFNNSADQYAAQYGSEHWASVMGFTKATEKAAAAPSVEVNKEVSE